MVMTNEEIVRDYLQARNKSKQIKVLADLNTVTPAEIRAVLAEAGVEGVEAPKRIVRRKKPPTAPPETEAPPSAASEPPREDGPDIYRKIENILAALPGDMGPKARWAAGKMLAEVFAEYLMARLRLGEEDRTNEEKDPGRDLRREEHTSGK